MHSFFGLALVSVVWVLIGFSLAFAPDANIFGIPGLIGGLDFAGFMNVGLTPSLIYGTTIPFVLFAAFQLMFAAITPALITGAFAERKRFASFVIFTLLWSVLVYSPIAHWVWASDGWLYKLGALDFAGGTVVHASSGVSALIVALLIGRRVVNGDRMEPHDIPMTVLGAGLLWFGWFGFNAGSALAAERPRGERPARHEHRGRGRDDHLGPRELHPQAQGERLGRGLRRGRGPRRDHAGVRLRDRRRGADHRPRRRRPVLRRDAPPRAGQGRRRARRVRGPRRRRDVRGDRDRRLRDDADQPARPGPHRRQSPAGRDPDRRRRRPRSPTRSSRHS